MFSRLATRVWQGHQRFIPAAAEHFIGSASRRFCAGQTSSTGAYQAPEGKPIRSILEKTASLLTFQIAFGVGTLGYLQYAYDLPEVDAYVKELREKTDISADDFSINGAYLRLAEKYLELREEIEDRTRVYADPISEKLLPDVPPGTPPYLKTLVLDLDELLIHSDWTRQRGFNTFKRPGVDIFLQIMSQHFEVVVFSDQTAFYGDPILDALDQQGRISHRLYREATLFKDGKHFRDLSKLNRPIKNIIFMSAKPEAYCMQPQNAIPVPPWNNDASDRALLEFLPFLTEISKMGPALDDVRTVIDHYVELSVTSEKDIPTLFRERKGAAHQEMLEKKKKSIGSLAGSGLSLFKRGGE